MDIAGENKKESEKPKINIRPVKDRYDVIFWITLLVSSILFFVKLFIVTDISLADECHQIAVSYRFWQGDAPFVDDWSPEQLNGLAILPAVFMAMLTGSTSGLVLKLRVIYFLAKLFLAIWGYYRLKDSRDTVFLLAGVFIWYFSVPYNIDNITYQAIPLVFLYVAAVIFLDEKSRDLEYVAVGAVYALSILSQPVFVISYPVILVVLIFFGKIRDRKDLMFHIGIFTVAGLCAVLVFSRAGLSEILANFPYIFSEPDHDVASAGLGARFHDNVYMVFRSMVVDNRIVTRINVVYILALFLFSFLDDLKERLRFLMPVCLLASVISMFFSDKMFLMNEMLIPFVWLGIENLFFCRKKKYISLFLLSIIFAASVALGTNTGVLASSASLCWCAFIVLLSMERGETSGKYEIYTIVTSLVLVCLISLGLRVWITWWGEHVSPADCEYRITEGPMKGMYGAKIPYDKYMKIWNAISMAEISKDDILFSGSSTPLAYLDAEAEFGTMGTPFFYIDYPRVEKYFEMHPEKYPTVVYYNFTYASDPESNFYKEFSEGREVMTYMDSVVIK